ncbi:restriction endonuclease subunit S [Denitrobacterium detoxificans]|uniref:restriction endonuclease subunit S n=1 Tax=Denitrobacterium detoxificans TaxID=79604 RepID=UPI0026EEF345|nr:restriction endonuclease subunit S [Denitrobacterium detoxificans]
MCSRMLGELCSFSRGASVPRARMHEDGDYLYIHYGDLYKGFELRIDVNEPQKPIPYITSDERIKDGQWLQDQDIVYVLTSETVDDLGHSFLFNNPEGIPAVAGTETTIVRVEHRDLLEPAYLNYLMHTPRFKLLLRQYVKGMKVFRVHPDDLSRIEINLPSLNDQRKTVALLDAIFGKQIVARRTNDYLLDLGTAQFEAALQTDCREVRFGDIVELEDSKRIPLNSRDREQRKGPYPYYGATSVMDYVDDYLFDGIRILLGEDGSVITDDGYPVLQYVWGKYWVNNHAHILKPCDEYPMEMLYVALSRTAIPHIVTGAVQKKISQKNLNSLILEMPNPEDVKGLEGLFSLYRNNVDENKELEQLRDCLLPKLMSGKIDVSEVELPTLPNNHLSAD